MDQVVAHCYTLGYTSNIQDLHDPLPWLRYNYFTNRSSSICTVFSSINQISNQLCVYIASLSFKFQLISNRVSNHSWGGSHYVLAVAELLITRYRTYLLYFLFPFPQLCSRYGRSSRGSSADASPGLWSLNPKFIPI